MEIGPRTRDAVSADTASWFQGSVQIVQRGSYNEERKCSSTDCSPGRKTEHSRRQPRAHVAGPNRLDTPEIPPGALSTAVQKGRRAAKPAGRNGRYQTGTAATLVLAACHLCPRSESVGMSRRGDRTGRTVAADCLHASTSRIASAIRGRCSGPLGYVNLRTGICLTSWDSVPNRSDCQPVASTSRGRKEW